MDLSMYDFMKSKRRPFPEVKVKWYLYQILKGLEHLHKNGLFHRDIKPENILVKLNPVDGNSKSNYLETETVKLGDLGSIRGVYSRQPYTEYISTRWYRSPECLLSVGYYGPKMDIWAAGCVFYEMLTFRPLFPGSNEIDQLARIHSVLGSPSNRLVTKIKKKSHNCQNFPRQIGCGLKILMTGFSEDAQTVLKLMLQYDPETRINVRRLVDHRYFTPLRQYYLINQFKFNACENKRILERCSKAKGDHKTYLNSSSTSDQLRIPKFQTNSEYSEPKLCTTRRKEGEDNIKIVQKKTKKAPEAISTNKKKSYVHQFQQTVKSHPPTETTYGKTTPNLPNIFNKKKDQDHLTMVKQNQFYSKSLVIPRRSKYKVDSVTENWIEKVAKLNFAMKK